MDDDGEVHVAPCYLDNAVNHLSNFFKLLGPEGQYIDNTQVSACCG